MDFKQLVDQIKAWVMAALAAAGLSNPQRDQVQQLIQAMGDPTQFADGNHFILQVDVDFDGSASQDKPKSTKGLDRDVWIVGATTDLDSALVKISDDSSGYSFSNQRVNVKTLAGKSENAVPVLKWKPYPLQKGRTLSLDFKNAATGPDAAGYFAFVAIYLNK